MDLPNKLHNKFNNKQIDITHCTNFNEYFYENTSQIHKKIIHIKLSN